DRQASGVREAADETGAAAGAGRPGAGDDAEDERRYQPRLRPVGKELPAVNWIVIEGVKPWDGRYEFDLDDQDLTTSECAWEKRFSDYLPLALQQGLEGSAPELFCAFALVALWRADKITTADAQQVYDRLADAPFGSTIRSESDDAETMEVKPGPPASSSSASSGLHGDGSETRSGTTALVPPASWIPASA